MQILEAENLYKSGLSILEVANNLKVPYSRIQLLFKKNNLYKAKNQDGFPVYERSEINRLSLW